MILNYSQVEVAADARHEVWRRGPSLQMPRNEADAVRSARWKNLIYRRKQNNNEVIAIFLWI